MWLLVHGGNNVVAVQKQNRARRCIYLVPDNPRHISDDGEGYYSVTDLGNLIKAGFGSTAPTAALFVFSVLYSA